MLGGVSNRTYIRRRQAGTLIVGAGLAAQRATETLPHDGYDRTIRLLAAERHLPDDRPPLSKGYLAGEIEERDLLFQPLPWYADNDVELVLGRPAERVDIDARQVVLAGGRRLPFRRLLIATGATARHPRGTERYENVHELRTLESARRLPQALTGRPRVAVVGAGVIGQETAASAKRRGPSVIPIKAAPTPLAAQLGSLLGSWVGRFHTQRGIDVRLSAQISRFHGKQTVEAIELDNGQRIECELVFVGIGTEPATAWLRGNGLGPGGELVDQAGRTEVPRVFAAGDATLAFDRMAGGHVRTQYWEASARQRAAAHARLGLPGVPPAVPSFWSDQHGLRIQFVGHAGRARVVLDGDLDTADFTASFIRNGSLIGALLVGRPHALPAIRRALQQAKYHTEQDRRAA